MFAVPYGTLPLFALKLMLPVALATALDFVMLVAFTVDVLAILACTVAPVVYAFGVSCPVVLFIHKLSPPLVTEYVIAPAVPPVPLVLTVVYLLVSKYVTLVGVVFVQLNVLVYF